MDAEKMIPVKLDGYNGKINVGDVVTLKCIVKGVRHEPEYDWETETYSDTIQTHLSLGLDEIVTEVQGE